MPNLEYFLINNCKYFTSGEIARSLHGIIGGAIIFIYFIWRHVKKYGVKN